MEGILDTAASIKRLLVALATVLIIGTVGYVSLGYNAWDAFYSALIVMLSHFVHGVNDGTVAQLLEVGLIVSSYFILAYMIKLLTDYIFGGTLSENRRRLKMAKAISKMEDHYIICGYGRVGKQVAQEMASENVDFVVIDRSHDAVVQAENKGFTIIEGDPIMESSLKKAGIERAKALISALGDDADNVFLTLTARSMNPDLFIVSRASSEENISKLEKAGANKVSLPYQIGGYHMAGIALRPAVVDFLDVINDGRHAELQIEEVLVEQGSFLVGQKVGNIFAREKSGVTVLAINGADGNTKINPSEEEKIKRDDQLILMGTREQLEKIAKEIEVTV